MRSKLLRNACRSESVRVLATGENQLIIGGGRGVAVLAVAAANVRWTRRDYYGDRGDHGDDDDDGDESFCSSSSSTSTPVRCRRWESVAWCTTGGRALHRGAGVADGMCAVSRAPENVSRTSVAFGVASLAILVTGFVTGSWVTTREPYRVPGSDAYTAAAFRIGLWKVCPTLKNVNSTSSEYNTSACNVIILCVFVVQ